MKPVGYIYKITNKLNGRIYVGATTHSIHKRFQVHKSAIKTGKTQIAIIMREIGFHNFELAHIKTCFSFEQLRYSEMFFIAKYKSNEPFFGYNSTPGGEHLRGDFSDRGIITITVCADIKNQIIKLADDYERSENYIAGKILKSGLSNLDEIIF